MDMDSVIVAAFAVPFVVSACVFALAGCRNGGVALSASTLVGAFWALVAAATLASMPLLLAIPATAVAVLAIGATFRAESVEKGGRR